MANRAATNNLANEKSPYLRQHAANPVHWYPWGEEAFERARAENKPIFLSVGYSTCHWCHVMAHESFENNAIADIMNAHFVNIKVDREERPDVDAIYMIATQAITGSGGWPMSVWLTPDLKPFYAGTYFAPDERHGRASFPSVLNQLAAAWRDDRDSVLGSAQQISELLAQYQQTGAPQAAPNAAAVRDAAFKALSGQFDKVNGGFGRAPKFPMPVNLAFFLDVFKQTRDAQALAMAAFTVKKMAAGGIYDQLGGGFARYSTDERWLVPHFEKMLYDNAQMMSVIADLFEITQDESWRVLALDVIAYLQRDLRHPSGGFYAAEDADSEGKEGAFYVWTLAQIRKALPDDQADAVIKKYGLSVAGNFFDPHTREEGLNVLSQAAATSDGSSSDEPLLDQARATLFQVRARRPRPHRDEKVITEWNGLMLSALAKSARVFKNAALLAEAQKTAAFLKQNLYDQTTGRLYRRWYDGERGIDAQQSDFAMLIQGLLELAEAGDTAHLDWALALQKQQDELFFDEELGGYFMTTARPDLILRMKDDTDNVIPSGNSVAVMNGLRLSQLAKNGSIARPAIKTLRAFATRLSQHPTALASMCTALSYASNLGLIDAP
jgi:uncharacterized protein YyaL (SSP411 family)